MWNSTGIYVEFNQWCAQWGGHVVQSGSCFVATPFMYPDPPQPTASKHMDTRFGSARCEFEVVCAPSDVSPEGLSTTAMSPP
eukprot:112350-Chlamydomonas_euryale.AAC.5